MISLHHLISQQANRAPTRTAIELKDELLSYADLEIRANRIARLLIDKGCGNGDRVALLQNKTPGAIASVLGILKTGAVYVPIDTGNPHARIEAILADCRPSFALLDDRTESLWSALDEQCTKMITNLELGEASTRTGNIQSVASISKTGATHACLLYTSGSTGTPKGVAVRQESILEFVRWAQRRFEIKESSRVAGHTPLHFDLSLFDLFASLGMGATLVLVPPQLQILPDQLLKYFGAHAVTHLLCVPSLLSRLAAAKSFRERPLKKLRWLLSCGEVLPAPTANKWLGAHPALQMANLYGPTETTIASTCQVIGETPEVDSTIPIGSPCPGERIAIVNHAGYPVNEGEVGEICIAGVGLANGYWNNVTTSTSKFSPLPNNSEELWYRTGDLGRLENGLLYFHGRKDNQIKLRGYRIELGEVEAAAYRFDRLEACCVVAVSDAANGSTAIACAYTVAVKAIDSSLPIERQLRQHLFGLLPRYMVPTVFREYPDLPRTPNGKIDRIAISRAIDTSSDRETA